MGVRYSKSIKLGNYLRLNFSKSGITASIGKKGASINIGKKGTFLNLSPAAVGVNGTGVSYRTRIAGGKKKTKKAAKKKTYVQAASTPASSAKKEETSFIRKEEQIQETPVIETPQVNVIEEYEKNHEAKVNIHKYTDNVISKKEYARRVEETESEAAREIYELSIAGDEDTVENLVSTFMNNLEIPYDARVNFELEDSTLYVDLDLPEIEDLSREYPLCNSSGRISYRRKTSAQMKEEYSRLVISLGVFLSANFFNLSSYIDQIVMSAFTSVRDKKGDLKDQYLYSVKFDREGFEKADLAELDDLYGFLMRFENRINLSSSFNFKPIEPFEMESITVANAMIDDAAMGLRELGYKAADVNAILPELSKKQLSSSSEYLKEGLKLLNMKKR